MKNKKLIINILKMVLVFTLFLFNSYMRLLIYKIFGLNIKTTSETTDFIIRLAVYIILITIFALIYKKDIKSEWKNFTNKIGKNFDTAFKYYGIGLAAMIVFNIFINFVLRLGQSQNESAVQDMIKTSPILMIVFAGILAPIIEEIVFRKSLKNVFKNKWMFVIISGFIFGLLHVTGFSIKTPLEFLYILPYGSLGAMFAVMDYEIDSTFPSISMHMIHNTVLVLVAALPTLLH